MAGDFNVNLYNPSSRYANSYLDTVFSNGLLPLISRATHFMGLNPTCIDHILTNDIDNIITSGIIPYAISHHMPIFSISHLVHDSDESTFHNRPRFCIYQRTLDGFTNDFKTMINESMNDINTSTSKDSFNNFLTKFKNMYDKWFLHSHKQKCKSPHIKSDWITISLANSCSTKNKLYLTWRKNRTSYNWNTYIDYKRKLDKLLAKAKYDYYNKEFSNSQFDLKKTWNSINKILGRKRRSHMLNITDHDAPHNFNKYFTSIAHNLLVENYPENDTNDHSYKNYLKPTDSILNNDLFEATDLKNLISQLNNNKSSYFSPRVLKFISSELCPVLTKLFNKCYTDGYFPEELKTAKVIPLYKNKGNIEDLSNYRPISMLSIFSKLFEKLIYKRISDYFTSSNIINNSQYGFRAAHSTLHALINATENLYNSLDNNLHTLLP